MQYLAVATLVHKFLDGLEVGVAVGDVRLDDAKHGHGSRVDPHEHSVVDLEETEQLQDLADLGGDTVDTG